MGRESIQNISPGSTDSPSIFGNTHNRKKAAIHRKNYCFATTLLAHAVAANPENPNTQACNLLATSYEQLGFGVENAAWPTFYLTASQSSGLARKLAL
ncbi:hypothetical protein F66182_11476 [Fusarium sp. NRRL 66182]|nr:hypothetical protein F66182_11476 [Fusarium sp. NRRL 66182]